MKNKIISKYKSKSEFTRNVLTLMTGTTIAQAIPIAASPILTRIYTPADFGVMALFVAITSIFGSISSGRYELAIMLPKKEEDAINIFALGFILTTLLSLILLILVILFNDYIAKLLNNEEIRFWLFFIPVTVFFTGLFNILTYYNIRKKKYKDIRSATIIKSVISATVQLSFGFIQNGVTGLISGQIFSQMFANMRLFKNILKDKVLISGISKVKIVAQAKRYKDFPKFSLWAVLANTLSGSLINILISSFFSLATLGFYSLVQRVLGLPTTLIGGSIGQVFFQQVTKEKQETGKATNSFNSTVKKLFIIGIPIFGILFFLVEHLFAFVFGEEWRIAGVYAQILIPFVFIKFVSSTVSTINTVFEKQKIGLYINLLLLLTSITILYSSRLFNLDFSNFLFILSLALSLEYALFLLYYYKLSKGTK